MKTVILTSGPRGSGKSLYAETVRTHHPEITVVSRDQILIELFGSTSLNPYEGGHEYGFHTMLSMLREILSVDNPNTTILLDCWNGYSSDRIELIGKLRAMGADKVSCLQFLISADTCVEWFKKKPDNGGQPEYSIRNDHLHYYQKAATIEEDGFDEVFQINSNQLRFEDWPYI